MVIGDGVLLHPKETSVHSWCVPINYDIVYHTNLLFMYNDIVFWLIDVNNMIYLTVEYLFYNVPIMQLLSG